MLCDFQISSFAHGRHVPSFLLWMISDVREYHETVTIYLKPENHELKTLIPAPASLVEIVQLSFSRILHSW